MSFKLLYSRYDSETAFQNALIAKYKFPSIYMDKIDRIKDMKNRAATLAGHALLAEALKLYGLSRYDLYNLRYDKYKRPFIEGDLDFNISHTSGLAMCAITNKGKIGVDVEKIREFDICDCKRIFSNEEWAELNASENKIDEFYRLWTLKEAVTKADGRGFYIDPRDIIAQNGKVELDENSWNLIQLNDFPGFYCHIATNVDLEEHEIIEANIN